MDVYRGRGSVGVRYFARLMNGRTALNDDGQSQADRVGGQRRQTSVKSKRARHGKRSCQQQLRFPIGDVRAESAKADSRGPWHSCLENLRYLFTVTCSHYLLLTHKYQRTMSNKQVESIKLLRHNDQAIKSFNVPYKPWLRSPFKVVSSPPVVPNRRRN